MDHVHITKHYIATEGYETRFTDLLVQLDLLDGLVERDDLLAVVDHHPVPGVDLGRLVQEHL